MGIVVALPKGHAFVYASLLSQSTQVLSVSEDGIEGMDRPTTGTLRKRLCRLRYHPAFQLSTNKIAEIFVSCQTGSIEALRSHSFFETSISDSVSDPNDQVSAIESANRLARISDRFSGIGALQRSTSPGT